MQCETCRKALVWMGRACTPARAMLLAALVASTTLFTDFFIDDHVHLLTLEGRGYGASPFDLFCFGRGDPALMRELIEQGPYPWYTLPELKIHFFRPLSSALMVLDHALFGESAVLYHVHSLLWYVLLAWSAALVFRRVLPAPMIGIAIVVFVLDTTHVIPVLWWSNRNALVAAVPALFGLAAHLRWREANWKPGLPLSLLGYAMGLLGGESALGILGYVLAYEALARDDRISARAKAFAPGLLLAMAYLLLYKWGGYGVFGSGIYLDPISEWPAFLESAPGRLAELMATQFFMLPVELAVLSDTWSHVFRALSILAVLGMGFIGRALWRGLPAEDRRTFAWLGVGALIATVPCLATFPAGRLLTIPSLGACAIIAMLIHQGLIRSPLPRGLLIRASALTMAILHVVVALPVWLAAGMGITAFVKVSGHAFEGEVANTVEGDDRLVFCLYAPDPYTGFYPPAMWRRMGYMDSGGWQCFSVSPFPHEVTRTEVNRFEIRVVGGEILATPFERLMRGSSFPFQAGDKVELEGYTIEIMEVGQWGPVRIGVRLDEPLESDRYCFLSWQQGELTLFSWPALGESALLSPEDGFFAWPHFKKRLPLL